MSKAEGKKIAIKFSENIVSGIESPQIITTETQEGNYSVLGTYSGSADLLKDGNTGTYWQSRSGANVLVDLGTAKTISGFKAYAGASYRPTAYYFYTSYDGANYTLIKNGAMPAVTGWSEILLDTPVISRYVKVLFSLSSRLYLYEFSLLITNKISGFSVEGQEYEYTDGPLHNGPLVQRTYQIDDIVAHPLESNALLLSTDSRNSFKNAVGAIVVSYDQTKGSLAGIGGPVASFTKTFLPTELVEQQNPRVREYVNVIISSTINLTYITKLPTYSTDYIDASINCSIQLIHIDDINP